MQFDPKTMKPVYGPHDFPEDSSHENGDYECRCCLCSALFWGHKRREICRVCIEEAQERGMSFITEEELLAIQRRLRRAVILGCIGSALVGFSFYFLVLKPLFFR